MRVSITIPNHAELLCRVLEGLIEAGRLEIESGAVEPGPPEDLELIPDEDVIDPGAGEHWQLPSETSARGGGDCKDVSVWRAASLRASGEDEGATVQIWQVGPRDLHCVVLRSDGSTEDVWSELREGTWRLGFGFGDIFNPINHLKKTANVVSAAMPFKGPTGSPRQAPNSSAAWLSAPTTAVRSFAAALPGLVNNAPPAPPPQYGMQVPYGGIPTAPAGGGFYPSAGGGFYPGYSAGYSAGYPDPYAGIPFYDGEVEDDDDEDDDQEELREELAELRGELRGQRRALRDRLRSASSSSQDLTDDGAGA